MGFTAGTGGAGANQDIVNWTYTPNRLVSQYVTNVPQTITTYTYDTNTNYGHLIESKITGNDLGATPTIDTTTTYIYKDAFSSTTTTPMTGTYLLGRVDEVRVKDQNGTIQQCANHGYDDLGYLNSGSNTNLTRGMETTVDRYPDCSHIGQNGNTTRAEYDLEGNPLASRDADGHNNVNNHCTFNSTTYGACTTYDTQFAFMPTGTRDALDHTTSTTYGSLTIGGLPEAGLWPTSATDANGQTTSYTYDGLGRVLNTSLPGETSSFTTQMAYSYSACPATGASAPCAEVDTTQRLDNSTTVIHRVFYDGFGRQIETRDQAPSGQDVVQYAKYDSAGNQIFLSQPFFVTAYTGSGSTYYTPSNSEVGKTTSYNGIGQVTGMHDAVGASASTTYTVACNVSGTSDAACYALTSTSDPNHHGHITLVDGLGRTAYQQDDTGDLGSGVYRTTHQTYDVLGNSASGVYADGTHTRTNTYNALSQLTSFSDPDLGNYTLSNDADGNVLSMADPRGASGTVYMAYDALNRLQWKGPNSNGSGAYATYNYDETHPAPNTSITLSNGIGRLTSETFSSNGVSGYYLYDHDVRGRQSTWHMSIGGTDYPFTTTYNDNNQETNLQYPNGDQVGTTYSAQGWLGGVTYTPNGGSAQTLVSSLTYSGLGGAAQAPTGATGGNSTTWTLTYDNLARLTERKVQNGANPLFDQTRTFDSVGNVKTVYTALPGSNNDNQAFCYDQSDRLTWAGDYGTPSCGGSAISGTTLPTASQYQQSYTLDTLDRLTQGPAGSSYTYSDSNHLDGVTSTASGYGAAYDSAGDMTCRAPAGSGKTCSGTPTGQPMTYDALRRLLTWQNAPSSPTSTTSNAYDGEGARVAQTVTSGGTTTTTYYIAGYEEVSTTGGTTTTTEYCATPLNTVVVVGGTLSWLANDDLGSVSVALSATGTVSASELYTPYGTVRYTTGTMPTSKGFIGQRLDTSGLNYFNARFYDAGVGLFTTADEVQGPNRYAYAGDNPTTRIDPLGRDWWNDFWNTVTSAGGAALDFTFNFSGMGYDLSVVGDGSASFGDRFLAGADFALNLVVDGTIVADGADLALRAAGDLVARLSLSEAEDTEGMAARGGPGKPLPGLGANAPNPALLNDGPCAGGGNSFAAETPVATPEGEKPIGQMQVGNQVLAYDPTTGQPKAETVDHVFINHDTNLLDVTLAPLSAEHDASPKTTSTTTVTPNQPHTLVSHPSPTETLHTTTEHPFLTTDRGFVDAQNLHVGEHVQELDGHIGVVVAVMVTPGAAVRYNLTVRELHTYAVGVDRWVVHNVNCGGLPTTVSTDAAGNVTVVSGLASQGPRFSSTLSADGSAFTVSEAFRENLAVHASDVLAEQFVAAGGNAAKLQNIILDEVIEPSTLSQYVNTGTVSGSPLDKLAKYFATSIGVTIGSPSWVGGVLNGAIYYPVIH